MARSRWALAAAVGALVLGLLHGGESALVREHQQQAAVTALAAEQRGRAEEQARSEAAADVEKEAHVDAVLTRAAAERAAEEAAERAAAKKAAAKKAEAQRAAAAKRSAAKAAAAGEAPAVGDAADDDAADDDAADDAARAAGWHDAASREHCAEPDQVWTASNGRIPDGELAAVPWSPSDRVRADVVDDLADLDAAFRQAFGRHLSITSAYRTHAQQTALYDPSSKVAAPPGCSNHGTGLAVDLGGGVQQFGSAEYYWLKEHAPAYGWVHPPFAEPDGRNPEPWHWQSVLAPNSR